MDIASRMGGARSCNQVLQSHVVVMLGFANVWGRVY